MTPAKPNPLVEIAITIIAPSVVLMYGSERLGNLPALLLALAFPVSWGVWDGVRRRKINWLAVIGVVSALLTGGIGLLKLDTGWFAVKEGAVSGLIGLVFAVSAYTKKPLIKALLFDAALLDTVRLERALEERGTGLAFEASLRTATLGMAGTFFFSAVANYLLARWIVTSPTGSAEFNAELGRLTLLSYPVIALPSMLMMAALVWWLSGVMKRLTGLSFNDLVGGPH